MKNLGKQLILIAKDIGVRLGDVSRRLAHEAKASEVVCLALGLLILL
jgi:hypothetical protein